MSNSHPIIQDILEAHGAPKPRVTHPDLADGVRYIAAHEPDPRKEELLYEAAELLEWYETSGESTEQPRERTSVLAPLLAIDAILQDVAELPDDYADDDPNVMRVSVDDLRVILERHS